jgi:peptide/nickel transport system permease protein
MSSSGALTASVVLLAKRASGIAALRRVPLFPSLLLAFFVLLAAFADWIAPYPAHLGVLSDRLLPPFWQDGGVRAHMLGTDLLGRDVLSRIIYGARVSLAAAAVTVLAGAAVGTALGLTAGYHGRWVDAIIMRAADAMLSLPIILIALLFAVVFGPSFSNVILVLALAMWARFARLVRGEVLSWKQRDFVALARIAGASSRRIILRHLFPNVVNPLVVLATLQLSWVIILEAGLSFLGAGIPPPTPSWGSMVSEGRGYLSTAWWISFFPGAAIVLLVLALNLLGDWLRDALDPRTRHLGEAQTRGQ